MANHESKSNPMVFFELSVGGEKREGRIEMELFADKTPKTAENFRALCTGEKGVGDVCGYPLHYKGTSIHSISPGLMWCGGDITHGNADGESIYGAVFEDENFIVKHSCPGILSMANASENTNESQFMILTRACHLLDDVHVAFGRVVKGLDLMMSIEEEVATEEEEEVATEEESGRPSKPVVIVNCGMIPPESTEGASSNA